MDQNSAGRSDSYLRNRRLGSFFKSNSDPNIRDAPNISNKKSEVAKQTDGFVVDDDDGWVSTLVSCVRIVICFLIIMVTTFIWTIIMVFLIPWPSQRIKQGNFYGHVTGRLLMWILGNPVKIEGREFSNERAIYISNHASLIDVFLAMWLAPTGTVAIAKKEIIWYPLFGQLYLLSNHLRIDRSNPSRAIQSMKKAVQAVIKHNLSLMIFPEGTRSENGRLLPFKKGFVHIALQSRLPIVPIILTGTHVAWRKGSLRVRPAPISVKFLPPIKTDSWTVDKIDDYVKLVHEIYVKNLPVSQKPIGSEVDTKNSSRS